MTGKYINQVYDRAYQRNADRFAITMTIVCALCIVTILLGVL